jgi:hypothetical protein
VSEGLTPAEVGKEIHEHAKHAHSHGVRDSRLTIAEAIVLSVVAIIAAWSGFSAAKWNTESHLSLSTADADHTRATRADLQSVTLRVGDATTFNAWFGAYISGKKHEAEVAARRFRPEYRVAWEAWMKTDPFTNPNAPAGPQSMPQYHPTGQRAAAAYDALAEQGYKNGEHEAATADDYVRTTVILASVLFLIGISAHFPVRGARIGMIAVGIVLLVFAVALILTLPAPHID